MKQKTILFIAVLALIGSTAAVLAHAKANQKLGLPGVKTAPLPDSKNLQVLLPENVPGYASKDVQQSDIVTRMLPQDTSYGQRLYTADDKFQALVNVVLMGSSRGSIHKPQICLTAQGWQINQDISRIEHVRMEKPVPYDLPVMLLTTTKTAKIEGKDQTMQGLYAYWFVDADHYTASHSERFMRMAQDVLLKGELDRWAYVAFFSVCAPGQENATFDRMKKLIAASVPEFQLVPKPPK
jgi:hypothetical protein